MKIVGVLMFVVILAGLYLAFSSIFGTGKLIDFGYNKGNGISGFSLSPRPSSEPVGNSQRIRVLEKQLVDATSKVQPVPPVGFTVSDLSPYYKKVRVGSVRPPKGLDLGSFEIRGESSLKEGVNVSGWRIKNNKNNI